MNNEFNGKLLMFVYINDYKCTFIHVHYHTLDYVTLLYMYASYSNVTTDHAAACHGFGRRYLWLSSNSRNSRPLSFHR